MRVGEEVFQVQEAASLRAWRGGRVDEHQGAEDSVDEAWCGGRE